MSEKRYLPLPFGITSLFCAALYTISWQSDPCSQYRVDKSRSREKKGQKDTLSSKKSVVTLTRKNELPSPRGAISHLVSMHSVIAVSAFVFCYWKLSSAPGSQPDKTVVGIIQ